MDQGIAALLGVFIGGVITTAATVGGEWWRDRKQSRNLALAVAGELAAVAEVVRRRQWITGVAGAAEYIRKTGRVIRYTVHLPDEFMVATRSAMLQAGHLPGALPTLVPRAVLMGDGVAADFRRLARFEVDDENGFLHRGAPEQAAATYTELYALICNALRICDEIVDEVERLFPGQVPKKTPIIELAEQAYNAAMKS